MVNLVLMYVILKIGTQSTYLKNAWQYLTLVQNIQQMYGTEEKRFIMILFLQPSNHRSACYSNKINLNQIFHTNPDNALRLIS